MDSGLSNEKKVFSEGQNGEYLVNISFCSIPAALIQTLL